MNTELRNKLFNKIKNVFENEDTQEREDFLAARESVDYHYDIAKKLAKDLTTSMPNNTYNENLATAALAVTLREYIQGKWG